MRKMLLLKWKFDLLELKPVLVVGAGLSAADAVTICRSSGIGVIHVYRNRSAGLDKMLPETVYPEYHEVSDQFLRINPFANFTTNFTKKKNNSLFFSGRCTR